jgi:hypothetical protein
VSESTPLECGPCWQTVLQHKKTVSKQMILCVAREHTALERVKTRETRGLIITWGTREAGRRAAPGGTAPLMVATTKQQQLGETWNLELGTWNQRVARLSTSYRSLSRLALVFHQDLCMHLALGGSHRDLTARAGRDPPRVEPQGEHRDLQ